MRDQDGARIFGEYLGHEIVLQDTPTGVQLTAEDGDKEATVVLHPGAVRELRLALQDAEKRQHARGDQP